MYVCLYALSSSLNETLYLSLFSWTAASLLAFTKTAAKSRVGGGGGGWGWRATKTWEWSVHVALVLVYCPGSVVYQHRGLGSSDGAPSAGQAVRR